MQNSKNLHKIITKASYYCGDRQPQHTYHRLFDHLRELGCEIPEFRTKKMSKLDFAIQQGFLPEVLTFSLDLIRNASNLYVENENKQMSKILTGTCRREKIDGIRHYYLHGKTYPSVTAILKDGKSDVVLNIFDKWRERLIADYGEKKGTRKAQLSTKIGDFTHASLETYLLKLPGWERAIERTLAKHFKPILEEIDEVIAVELPVWNDKYHFAGSIDCVARLKDGSMFILDWKTSMKNKSRSACKDYFRQVAAYALALYSSHQIKVDGFAVCLGYRQTVGVRNPRRFDCHKETNIRPWLDEFLELAELFHERQADLNYTPF